MSDLPPYALVEYHGALIQTISRPFEEDNKTLILVRKPNDPSSMIRVETRELKVLKALCENCTWIYTPILNEQGIIICPGCGNQKLINEIHILKK